VIGLEVDIFFLLYLGAGLVLIFSLWFYYDWKDKHLHEAQRSKVIYHCIKCSHIYTGPYRSTECDCPKCGFNNGRLQF